MNPDDDKSKPTDRKQSQTRPDSGDENGSELGEDALDQVSGGAVRRYGDEDLEDLEVQR